MSISSKEWLELIEREYIGGFVTIGGSMVKFVVGDDQRLFHIQAALQELAARHGMLFVAVDAATTKLHMIQDVFFAIARTVDWHATAQYFVEALFARQSYEWPDPGVAVPLQRVAEAIGVDLTILRRDLRQWLTSEVMRDPEMTQDFRVAMTRLCQRRLEPEDNQPGITVPVVEWLRGELRGIGALRDASITSKITRHNGRAMLRSICRWLSLCGRRGICVALDIRQLGRTGAAAGSGVRYTSAAVMDGFEVLRQLIDDAEHFGGLVLVVLADEALIGDDPKRSLGAYQALKMRVWDDVRPKGRDNPLAPLVRLASQLSLEPVR